MEMCREGRLGCGCDRWIGSEKEGFGAGNCKHRAERGDLQGEKGRI